MGHGFSESRSMMTLQTLNIRQHQCDIPKCRKHKWVKANSVAVNDFVATAALGTDPSRRLKALINSDGTTDGILAMAAAWVT